MAKARTIFVCRQCGAEHGRWLGRCPSCATWDSLEEQAGVPSGPVRAETSMVGAMLASRDAPANHARPASEIEGEHTTGRLSTGLGELDRVLGGGLVPASSVLVGGDPGIGKSTLLLQAGAGMRRAGEPARVLYASSEESASQVAARARRVGGSRPEAGEHLFVLAETNLRRIAEEVQRVRPAAFIIDSIQMVFREDVPGAPGSVSQLRRCAADSVALAKATGSVALLVGHVTKDGALAGPRLLEHLVDAVLSFEGDRYHAARLIRSAKNRFGTALELGVFEMTPEGLREAPDGVGSVSVQNLDAPRPGSVPCPVMAGSRCVSVEVQALTATGFPGSVKRKCAGLDANRLAIVLAVLEQHAGLRLADRDVFANVAGGLRVGDPASDLALALAVAGAQLRRTLSVRTGACGEVGLGGEIRPVGHVPQRLRDAARLGIRRLLVPKGSPVERVEGIQAVEVATIGDAMDALTRETPTPRP